MIDGAASTAGSSPRSPSGYRTDSGWTKRAGYGRSSGDGVRVFTPDGEQLLHVPVPEKVANLCFGGPDGRDLYIAASTSLYRIRTSIRNAPRPAPGAATPDARPA